MAIAERVRQQNLTAQEVLGFFEAIGHPLESLEHAENLRLHFLRDDYPMSYDQTGAAQSVAENSKVIAKLLVNRYWTVAYRTENQSNKFTTCDHPVMLYRDTGVAGSVPPKFAFKRIKVYVPLTMNTVLFGVEEKDYLSGKMTNHEIKQHNFITTRCSDRFIFSKDKEFTLINEKGEELTYAP